MNENEKLFYGLARSSVRDMEEYDPGPMPADIAVRVSANENNRGVPQKARDALLAALDQGNRYPESRCGELREAIAGFHGLNAGQILVGNGLDGVFTMLGRAFLEPGDEVITAELTFSAYEDMARIAGATTVTVPMTDGLALDADGFIGAVGARTKLICFCNPNNPTGTMTPLIEIERMLDTIPREVIFLLDEAYIEFADDPRETGLRMLKKYPNLAVSRTFSKIFGLAGLRVGYIAADPMLLKYLYKVREPYCVNTLSAAAAIAALRDKDYCERSREETIRERAALCEFFRSAGVKYVPSQGNFILVIMDNAAEIRGKLLDRGVAVRLLGWRGKKNLLRISLGLPQENEFLKKAFTEAIGA